MLKVARPGSCQLDTLHYTKQPHKIERDSNCLIEFEVFRWASPRFGVASLFSYFAVERLNVGKMSLSPTLESPVETPSQH
jgi:hypothetical protein